jgi:hypothetical protein
MPTPDEDFDSRLRDWVQPDAQTVLRVKTRALAGGAARARPARRLVAWAMTFLLLLAVGGMWMWRHAPPDAEVMTATLDGDVLIIRAPDGSACVLGPSGGGRPIENDVTIYQGER